MPACRSACPGIDGPLVGQVVHGVLEIIDLDESKIPGDLGSAIDRPPVAVPWPPPDRVEELLRGEAPRVARTGRSRPRSGWRRCWPHAPGYLEVERELEWTGGSLSGVLGPRLRGPLR